MFQNDDFRDDWDYHGDDREFIEPDDLYDEWEPDDEDDLLNELVYEPTGEEIAPWDFNKE